MTRWLLLGSLLGLLAGGVPGPFSALVAATALERGFRHGLKIAFLPLGSETAIMLVTALVLFRVPEGTLRWMGAATGLLVFYLAWRTWRAAGERKEDDRPTAPGTGVAQAAAVELLSPAPWVFWLMVGSPLVLTAFRQGTAQAAAFVASFLAALAGAHATLAFVASRGRNVLEPRWRARLLRAGSGALVLAGGVLVWHAWTGNFQTMVRGTDAIREIVDEADGA